MLAYMKSVDDKDYIHFVKQPGEKSGYLRVYSLNGVLRKIISIKQSVTHIDKLCISPSGKYFVIIDHNRVENTRVFLTIFEMKHDVLTLEGDRIIVDKASGSLISSV